MFAVKFQVVIQTVLLSRTNYFGFYNIKREPEYSSQYSD
jgi:hypothetical protein